MFAYGYFYRIQYFYELPNGKRQPVSGLPYIRGDLLKELEPLSWKSTLYGIGSTRAKVTSYLRFLADVRRRDAHNTFSAVGAELEDVPYGSSQIQKETLKVAIR